MGIENYMAMELFKRLDLLAQMDEFDEEEVRTFIVSIFLPSLEMGYQNAKEFLKSSSKSRVYTIKKALIDLLEGTSAIKIHGEKDEEIRSTSKFASAFLLLEVLAGVYSFAVMLRNKVQNTKQNNTMIIKLSLIIREVKNLEDEIQAMMETRVASLF